MCLLVDLEVAKVIQHALDAEMVLFIVSYFEDLLYLGIGNAKAPCKVWARANIVQESINKLKGHPLF